MVLRAWKDPPERGLGCTELSGVTTKTQEDGGARGTLVGDLISGIVTIKNDFLVFGMHNWSIDQLSESSSDTTGPWQNLQWRKTKCKLLSYHMHFSLCAPQIGAKVICISLCAP